MIIFYSKTGVTKKYAETIKDITGHTLFELKETGKVGGMLKNVIDSLAKKTIEIESVPNITKESVLYICSPIWASNITPMVYSYLKKAHLQKKTIKILLTSAVKNHKYIANTEKLLQQHNIIPEKILLFSVKEHPEPPISILKKF